MSSVQRGAKLLFFMYGHNRSLLAGYRNRGFAQAFAFNSKVWNSPGIIILSNGWNSLWVRVNLDLLR